MKTIWKYKVTGTTPIAIPRDAQLLSVRIQHGVVQLWALVDPKREEETLNLSIFGTGNEVPPDIGPFLGTFFVQDGLYVFHVFESEWRDDEPTTPEEEDDILFSYMERTGDD